MSGLPDAAFIVLFVVLLSLWLLVAGILPVRRHVPDETTDGSTAAGGIGPLIAGAGALALAVALLIISAADGLDFAGLAGAAVFLAIGVLAVARWARGAKRSR